MYVELIWNFYVQLFFDGSTIPEFIGFIIQMICFSTRQTILFSKLISSVYSASDFERIKQINDCFHINLDGRAHSLNDLKAFNADLRLKSLGRSFCQSMFQLYVGIDFYTQNALSQRLIIITLWNSVERIKIVLSAVGLLNIINQRVQVHMFNIYMYVRTNQNGILFR